MSRRFVGIVLVAGMAAGSFCPAARADGERGAESGSRTIRFKGTVKAVDLRTGRFVVPVRRGRDGDPAPNTVDVLIVTAGGTRFTAPAAESGANAPVRFRDLVSGATVNVSGIVGRDGSVLAQEVTLFRKAAGTEAEGGRRASPEAEGAPRRSPEAERPDGDTPRRSGARDGETPRIGPRDGEGVRPGAERESGRPGAEGQTVGWLAGRVKALDLQRGTFLMEWRVTEAGGLRTVRGPVAVGADTRLTTAAGREGAGPTALTFRDLQIGSIVHVRGTDSPNGLLASEIRVFPAKAGARRPEAGREGDGRRPAEGEGRR